MITDRLYKAVLASKLPPEVAERHIYVWIGEASHNVVGIKKGGTFHLGFAKNEVDAFRLKRLVKLMDGNEWDEIGVIPIHCNLNKG